MSQCLNLALAIIVLSGTGCSTTEPSGPVPVRPVGIGTYSAISEPTQVVVRDAVCWQDLWSRHVAGTGEVPHPPPVFFDREMAVAVFLGRQNTAGYRIAVERADVSSGAVRVYVRREAPPPGAVTAAVITSPFHMVAMPGLSMPVEFIDIHSP